MSIPISLSAVSHQGGNLPVVNFVYWWCTSDANMFTFLFGQSASRKTFCCIYFCNVEKVMISYFHISFSELSANILCSNTFYSLLNISITIIKIKIKSNSLLVNMQGTYIATTPRLDQLWQNMLVPPDNQFIIE